MLQQINWGHRESVYCLYKTQQKATNVLPTEEGYLGVSHPLEEQYSAKVKFMTEWIPGNIQSLDASALHSARFLSGSAGVCSPAHSIPACTGPSDWGHLSQEIWLLQFPSILYYSPQRTCQKFFLTMSVKQESIFASVFEKFSKSSPFSESWNLLPLNIYVFNMEPTFTLTNL